MHDLGLMRRGLMMAQSKKSIDIWDGTTETVPAIDSEGFYEINNGAELAYFNKLTAIKKCKICSDFALNADYENFETWDENPPANNWIKYDNQTLTEVDGNGFTIYGLYSSIKDSALFSIAYPNCCIKNLRISNFYLKDSLSVLSPEYIASPSTSAYNIVAKGNISVQSSTSERYGGAFFKYWNFVSANSASHDLIFNGKLTNLSYAGMCGGIAGRIANPGVAGAFKNCAVIGSIVSADYYKDAGLANALNTDIYPVDNCFTSVIFSPHSGTATCTLVDTDSPSTYITHSYYDSTKNNASVSVGSPRTTAEIKTQTFVDLLNANLPSGCTPWKLGTDGYPDLDF